MFSIWLILTLTVLVFLICYMTFETVSDGILDAISDWSSTLSDFLKVWLPPGAGVLIGVFGCLTVLNFPSLPNASKPTVWNGTVVSRDTKLPIAGCEVSIGAIKTITEGNGSFVLRLPQRQLEQELTQFHHEQHEPRHISMQELSALHPLVVELQRREIPIPIPVPPVSIRGTVVAHETHKPISDCVLSLGQAKVSTTEDGSFIFLFNKQPDDDMLLRISHDEYLQEVIRFGDLILAGNRKIELRPKMRFLIAKFDCGDRNMSWESLRNDVLTRMSGRLNECSDVGVLADDKRDQVLDELYRFQESRGSYDIETLPKFGKFHGATHGIFGSIKPGKAGSIDVECSIIDLQKGKKLQSALLSLKSEKSKPEADSAADMLIDELLAKMSEVIFYPRNSDFATLNTTVQGHVRYLPETWTLWMSVLPYGTDRHFPQLRLTQANGSWLASHVQIGTEEKLSEPRRFEIYAVLTSPEGTRKIEEYHARVKNSGENEGLELNAWEDRMGRCLGCITVTRNDTLITHE